MEWYTVHMNWKNIVKVYILLKATYGFNVIPNKISMEYFA